MRLCIVISVVLISLNCKSQTFKYAIQSEALKSSLGLYNVGWEIFVKPKDTVNKEQNSFIPIIGFANTNEYRGWEVSIEHRDYLSWRWGKSWKEYMSVRVEYGNFFYNDLSSTGLRKNYFGISAGGGLRKYFFNHFFLDVYTGLGYFNNVPQLNGIFFNDKKVEPFNTHLFPVEGRLCIGWAF
jgi:hypothetical protein